MTDALGARHSEVKRLRALLRDPKVRASERAAVLEGPKVVAAALDRAATLEAVYLGPRATDAFAPLIARLDAAGVPHTELKEGVLEKVGITRTPQPVLAVASTPVVRGVDLPGDGVAVVAVDVSDPGNLGTIIRSAEAAGADGVICCGDSVDPSNPKVVRASAGAIFGIPIRQSPDPLDALIALQASGRRLMGAVSSGGQRYDDVDLARPTALVMGNEAHGLPADLAALLDELISIPMASVAESLNVAMATTVVLFEAARQRRLAGARP